MDASDVVRMQEEFVKNVSEFSARFLSAWSDAVKQMGFPAASESLPKLGSGWIELLPATRPVGSNAAAERFQEAMQLAAEDLPAVVAARGDPEKVERIKSKWAKFYEQTIRDVLGIPSPSDAARLLDRWRAAVEHLPSMQQAPLPAPTANFIGLLSPSGWPVPGIQDQQRELFRMWADSYGKTFGKILPSPAKSLGENFEERTRKALDAQMRFLKCLPDFQSPIVAASKNAIDKVFEKVKEPDFKEITPQSLKLFCDSLVSANERMFEELFGSDPFLQMLTKAVQQGMDAKKKMESVMADWASAWSLANQKDVEDLRHNVYTLEKRVRLLERELEDIKRGLEEPPPQEAARTGFE